MKTKKIHLLKDCEKLEYDFCVCEIVMPYDDNRCTNDINKVTCKRCLKLINNKKDIEC